MKNKVLVIIVCILAVLGTIAGIYVDNETKEKIEVVQNMVLQEIDRIEETDNNVDTVDNASTTTIEDLSIEEEQALEEQETENEAFELQGNIVYEGEKARTWDVELGNYAGLTYYSQVDSRWKSHVYTSIGDKSQTIGTSGCGPTSAAMIVSSIKGTITPDVMGDLFVQNGYRSANSGTYWSAFRAVADEFNIGYEEISDIQKALQLLQSKHYVIASVGNGLFTYGGHFIVIVSVDNNTLKIYDPYLYNGKFDTSTRRKKVTVEGNTVYCSVDNFKKYANYKGFFAFEYTDQVVKENSTDNQVTTKENITNTVGNTYTLSKETKLYTNSSMNSGCNYLKGTKVKVLENITSKIDKIQIVKTGLIRYAYSSDYIVTKPTTQNTSTSNLIVGKTYSLSINTKLFTNQNMSSGYGYLKGTKIKVLQVTNSIAKVQIIKTGLTRYVNEKYLK